MALCIFFWGKYLSLVKPKWPLIYLGKVFYKLPLFWPYVFQSRYSFNPRNGASQHKPRSAHVTGQITTPVWSTFVVYPGNLVNLHFLRGPFRNPASSPCLLGSRSRGSILGQGIWYARDFHLRVLSIPCRNPKHMHTPPEKCTGYLDEYVVILGFSSNTKAHHCHCEMDCFFVSVW